MSIDKPGVSPAFLKQAAAPAHRRSGVQVMRSPPASIRIGARQYRSDGKTGPLSEVERHYFLAALHPANLQLLPPDSAPDEDGIISYLGRYPAHLDPAGQARMRVTLQFDHSSNLRSVAVIPAAPGRHAPLCHIVLTPLAAGTRGSACRRQPYPTTAGLPLAASVRPSRASS